MVSVYIKTLYSSGERAQFQKMTLVKVDTSVDHVSYTKVIVDFTNAETDIVTCHLFSQNSTPLVQNATSFL